MISTLRHLVRDGQYRLTLHARSEMDCDGVSGEELVRALAEPDSEIIQDYPDDPRGHSHLVLAWLGTGNPLHTCCALHEGQVVIITVYRPSEVLTKDWRKRK